MLKEKLLNLGIFEENEYFYAYIDLIEKNKQTKKEQFKTAIHHIIPKAYFKKLNLPIDNSEDNLVNLLHKDHALAHYYIALATKDPYFLYSSMSALQHIMGFNKKMNQEDITTFIFNLDKYQELVEQKNKYHSEHLKGLLAGEKNPAKRPEVKEKLKKDWHKKHLNSCNTGKKHTLEWKKSMSSMLKGRVSIIKENKQLHVKKEDLNKYLNDGWIIGNKNKGIKRTEEQKKVNGLKHKGKIRVTNGVINKNISTDELEQYLNKGFWRGLTTISKDKRKKREGSSSKNKIAVHKPDVNKTKYINKEDVAKFIEEGYILGAAKRNKKDVN